MNEPISRKEAWIIGLAVAFIIGTFDWVGISNLNTANLNRSHVARSIYCAMLANQKQASIKVGFLYQPPSYNGADPCSR